MSDGYEGTPARPPNGRPAVRRRLQSLWLLALALALLLVPDHVFAIACPSGGAKVKVCVTNPTTATSPTITVSGQSISNQATCLGPAPITGQYSTSFTVAPGSTYCTSAIPSNGLFSGMYVHRIHVAATGQDQYQQDPVLFSSTGEDAEVDWTYYPHVYNVTALNDPTCTNDCNGSSCTFRQAIVKANNTLGNDPVLIQFGTSGTVNLTQSGCNLLLTRSNVTIDGTDSSGNPWIVGDPNAAAAGNQDSIPRKIDLNDSTSFRITGADTILKGLHIKNTVAGGIETRNIVRIDASATGTRLRAVKVEGGTIDDCSMDPCNGPYDTILVSASSVSSQNVEAHSAINEGVRVLQNASAVVADSWIHNNYKGGIAVGAEPDETGTAVLAVVRGMVEKAGRRLSDDLLVKASENGIYATKGGIAFVQGATVRLNSNHGVSLAGMGSGAAITDSFLCGNSLSGARANDNTIFAGHGTSFAYNGSAGFSAVGTGLQLTSGVNLSNAFADNDPTNNCDFENSSDVAVNAENNQWGTVTPRVCGNSTTCGNGQWVDCDPVLNVANLPIDVSDSSPTYPSNILLQGQSLQINGSAFDAIKSNPEATNRCNRGNNLSSSCCTTTGPTIDVCGSGTHDPQDNAGTCVELYDPNGQGWWKLTVRSVTPTTIVTEMPSGTGGLVGCLGDDSEVWVSDKRAFQNPRSDRGTYCSSSAPANL